MTAIRRSVDRRSNGRWRARYVDPETQKWVGAGSHRTKTLGHEAIDGIIVGIGSGTHAPADRARMTFADYVEKKFWISADVAPTSRERYDCIFRHYLKPRWGAVALGDIEMEDIERWVKLELPITLKVSGEGVIGASYQRQAYWLFHKIIGLAVERRFIGRSPLPRRSGLVRQQPTKPTRVLDPSDVECLAVAASSVLAGEGDLIYTAAYGGFRCGELLALRVDDLDFDHCEISVDEQVVVIGGQAIVQGDLKRQRSHRTVPMPRLVMEMLAARIMTKNMSGNDLVFPDTKDGPRYPTNWRNRIFEAAVTASKLPRLTPHDLRHTAASAWFDEGFDIVEVARMLGDSLMVAERTYVHLYRGRRPERMVALDARLTRGRRGPDNVVQLPTRAAG